MRSCETYPSSPDKLLDLIPECRDFLVPEVEEGGACGMVEEEDGGTSVTRFGSACKEGLTCVVTEENGPICQSIIASGESCNNEDQCGSEGYCSLDSDVPTCNALLTDGESCTSPDQCVSEHCGEEMTCVTLGAEAMCMP